MRFSRGENELYVRRGLFQSLKKSVESAVGEHMDFINYENLVAAV